MERKFRLIIILSSMLSYLNAQSGNALEYYLKGEYAKLNNDFDLALTEFYKALSTDSNSVIILGEIAKCHQLSEDTLSAKKYYLKAFYNSNHSLDNGLEILDFFDLINENKVSGIILDTLKKYHPSNVDLKYRSIRNLYLNQKYEDLLDEYKEIYLIESGNKEIIPKLIEIGIALNKKEYLEKILIDIVDSDPTSIQPLLAIGGLKIDSGFYLDAILYIEKAYEVSKNDNILINLIDISKNIKMNDLVEKYMMIYEKNHGNTISIQSIKLDFAIKDEEYYYALKLIKSLINSSEINIDILDKLILVSNKLGEIEIAERILIKNHFKDNENILFPILLGEINGLKGRSDEALKWYLKSLNLDKSNITLRHIIANLSENLFKYDLSDSIFLKIIEDDSTDARGLNNYAYSLCERPNPNLEFALELSQKAIKLELENAAFLDTIGWIYYRLGNYNLAYDYIIKSIKIDSGSEIILNHLAEVYLKLNMEDEAINIYLEILDINPQNQSALKKIKELNYE